MAPPELVSLDNGHLRLTVQPGLGAGLTRLDAWHRGGWVPLLRPRTQHATDPEQLACCLLMPWSNRIHAPAFPWRGQWLPVAPSRAIDPLPLHGDAWTAPWRVRRQGHDEITLAHDGRKARPFAYDGEVHYRLGQRSLQVLLRLRHRGDEPLPYGLGLHPWFVRTPDTEIAFASHQRWEPEASQAPQVLRHLGEDEPVQFTRPRRLPPELIDHAYTGWGQQARIHWPGRGLALTLRACPRASHLMVYSPPTADFVCLEPVSHRPGAHTAPDPITQGLVELQPGEELSLDVAFDLEAD